MGSESFSRILITGVFFAVCGQLLWQSASVAEAATGLRVRRIEIEVRDIFDEARLGWFYRSVNSVKASTKEEIVRRELLLKEGDEFQPFLLDESERNLRSLPFLRSVSITPIREGEWVDLKVSVQDTWTLYPFISLRSGGGTNNNAVGLAEANLLGFGKRLEVLYADDEGRQKLEGVWDDRRLLGSFNRLTLGHFERSDGRRTVASLGRPFRALVEPYAWSINADVFDLVGRLFEDAEESFIYRQQHTAVAGGYTFSRGDPEEFLRRYTIGYDYTRDEFSEADDEDFEDIDLDPEGVSRDPELLADDRYFSGPFVAYQQIEPDFLSINFVDKFERVEDFDLGAESSVSAHLAGQIFGSFRDTLLSKFYTNRGWRLGPTSFVRGELGGSGRADHFGISNALLNLQLKYVNVLGARRFSGLYLGKHTVVGSFVIDYGEKLDQDFQLALGATNGLRGYKDRTFTGDHRVVLNLEDRIHLIEDIGKLVSLGGAFFLDAGGAGESGFGDLVSDQLYSNIGAGLRFGLPRSSGGSVVRVDVAFPLRNGPDGSAAWEPRLYISSGQLFNSRLRSEGLKTQAAQISAGFLP